MKLSDIGEAWCNFWSFLPGGRENMWQYAGGAIEILGEDVLNGITAVGGFVYELGTGLGSLVFDLTHDQTSEQTDAFVNKLTDGRVSDVYLGVNVDTAKATINELTENICKNIIEKSRADVQQSVRDLKNVKGVNKIYEKELDEKVFDEVFDNIKDAVILIAKELQEQTDAAVEFSNASDSEVFWSSMGVLTSKFAEGFLSVFESLADTIIIAGGVVASGLCYLSGNVEGAKQSEEVAGGIAKQNAVREFFDENVYKKLDSKSNVKSTGMASTGFEIGGNIAGYALLSDVANSAVTSNAAAAAGGAESVAGKEILSQGAKRVVGTVVGKGKLAGAVISQGTVVNTGLAVSTVFGASTANSLREGKGFWTSVVDGTGDSVAVGAVSMGVGMAGDNSGKIIDNLNNKYAEQNEWWENKTHMDQHLQEAKAGITEFKQDIRDYASKMRQKMYDSIDLGEPKNGATSTSSKGSASAAESVAESADDIERNLQKNVDDLREKIRTAHTNGASPEEIENLTRELSAAKTELRTFKGKAGISTTSGTETTTSGATTNNAGASPTGTSSTEKGLMKVGDSVDDMNNAINKPAIKENNAFENLTEQERINNRISVAEKYNQEAQYKANELNNELSKLSRQKPRKSFFEIGSGEGELIENPEEFAKSYEAWQKEMGSAYHDVENAFQDWKNTSYNLEELKSANNLQNTATTESVSSAASKAVNSEIAIKGPTELSVVEPNAVKTMTVASVPGGTKEIAIQTAKSALPTLTSEIPAASATPAIATISHPALSSVGHGIQNVISGGVNYELMHGNETPAMAQLPKMQVSIPDTIPPTSPFTIPPVPPTDVEPVITEPTPTPPPGPSRGTGYRNWDPTPSTEIVTEPPTELPTEIITQPSTEYRIEEPTIPSQHNIPTNNYYYTGRQSHGGEMSEIATEIPTVDEDVIVRGNTYKLPTSSKMPVTTPQTTARGNAIIPVLAGLGAAAAAGIGAKTYLERKNNTDNESDDEFNTEDWSDNGELSIDYNEPKEETLDDDEYVATEPERYGARTSQELENIQ